MVSHNSFSSRASLNLNRAFQRDTEDHYARYRFCDRRDAYLFKAREIQKRRTDRASCTAAPFNIPVAGGEPITLALKYGNRATGSAYRRLDKRCDARSIGPPTDRGASALARVSLLHSALGPPFSRSVSPQSFVMYVTRSWLLSWHPAIPTSCRSYRSRSRVPPSPGRTWSHRARVELWSELGPRTLLNISRFAVLCEISKFVFFFLINQLLFSIKSIRKYWFFKYF